MEIKGEVEARRRERIGGKEERSGEAAGIATGAQTEVGELHRPLAAGTDCIDPILLRKPEGFTIDLIYFIILSLFF